MTVQDKYDELETIISGIDSMLEDIRSKSYIEDLQEIKYRAQEEQEKLEDKLQEEWEKEKNYMNYEYERSVI